MGDAAAGRRGRIVQLVRETGGQGAEGREPVLLLEGRLHASQPPGHGRHQRPEDPRLASQDVEEVVAADAEQARRLRGPNRRPAGPALQDRDLALDGARSDAGKREVGRTGTLGHGELALEDDVEGVAGLSLGHEERAGGKRHLDRRRPHPGQLGRGRDWRRAARNPTDPAAARRGARPRRRRSPGPSSPGTRAYMTTSTVSPRKRRKRRRIPSRRKPARIATRPGRVVADERRQLEPLQPLVLEGPARDEPHRTRREPAAPGLGREPVAHRRPPRRGAPVEPDHPDEGARRALLDGERLVGAGRPAVGDALEKGAGVGHGVGDGDGNPAGDLRLRAGRRDRRRVVLARRAQESAPRR